MNIFDILGPVMVGPSSSHTAGAVRIGYISKQLLQDEPAEVHIILHGSFATTGIGHGTDKALIAGLLDMQPDDMRIPDSFAIANKTGLKYAFSSEYIKDAHPNTAILKLTGKSGRKIEVQASSIGGGRIMINKIDGIQVNFSAEKPTLIVHNEDQPGHVSKVTSMLAENNVNIATMQLYRGKRGGYAVMVLEVDQNISVESLRWLENQIGIIKVTYINTAGKNGGNG